MASVTFPGLGNTKKRTHDAIEEEPTEQEVAAMSRSERKRHREKKRRSDVNKGFDELMALLLEIDPEVRADAEERASKGQCKRSLGAHEDNVLSRVDLIATAVRVLKRVHTENEKHKKMIEDFLKNKGGPSAADALNPRPGNPSSLPVTGGANPASLSDLNALAGLERATLLGLSSGAAGGAPAAPSLSLDPASAAAQIRAKAGLLGNPLPPTAPPAPSQLGDLSTADLLALRAARSQGAAAAANASRDAALFSQLNANKQAMQRNLFMQNLLQNQGAGGGSLVGDSLYGGLGSDQPGQSTGTPFSIAEGLYGALGGGRSTGLSMQKEEELRKLRAAGHQL